MNFFIQNKSDNLMKFVIIFWTIVINYIFFYIYSYFFLFLFIIKDFIFFAFNSFLLICILISIRYSLFEVTHKNK